MSEQIEWEAHGLQTRIARRTGRHRQQIHREVERGAYSLDWITCEKEEEGASEWICALHNLSKHDHYLPISRIAEKRGTTVGLREMSEVLDAATYGRTTYYWREDVKAFFRERIEATIQDTPITTSEILRILEMHRAGHAVSEIMRMVPATAFDVRAVILEAESGAAGQGRPSRSVLTRDVQRRVLNTYLLTESWSTAAQEAGVSRYMAMKIVDTHKKRLSKHKTRGGAA